MSDVQLYLIEVDKSKSEAQRIAAQSAARLQSNQLKLVDLITSLEVYINNREDASQRAKSVAYIADVLSSLPPKVLSGQERRLLCDFILGRIEGDLAGLGASARALISLEGLGKWDAATAQKVMQTFIQHSSPLRQFKLQTERYTVAQLVNLLLAKYRDAIQKLHESDPEFMPSFISYFEGEKDPRNLMIVFSLLQVPMTEWDIRNSAQDLFESVFNYFPITFKPPPDDPYGITAQDLKDRLRDCIASNSDFAPYAFPQLLDKLDSTSMNTKRDVLQTLQTCVLNYEPKTINLYSITFWDALKFEVLNVQEEDLALESLKALSIIALKLAEAGDGQINAYLRPIIKECNEHLEDAPTKQSHAAGRFLHAIASAGPTIADKIVKGVVPNLFSLFQSSESITKRRGLLEVFNAIFKAFVELSVVHTDLNTEALKACRSDALDAMLRALMKAPKSEVSFRLTSLEGLSQLVSVNQVLEEKEIFRAVDAVTDVVLHEQIEGHGDIRTEAIKALTSMARSVPDAIRDRSVPAFMVELPDSPGEQTLYGPVLESFVQLSTEQQIFDTIVLRLKNKLNAAKHQKAPEEYRSALLLAILYAFTLGSPKQESGLVKKEYYIDYAEPLVSDVKDTVLGAGASELQTIGRVCNVLLRPQGVHLQSLVYSRDLEWISSRREDSGAQAQVLTPFLLYYYAAIRPEVVDPVDITNLLRQQANLALNESGDNPSPMLRLIALLVNKFTNPKTMEATLETGGIEVESLISAGPSPRAISIAFAVVKALTIQGKCAAVTSKYLSSLLNLLPTSSGQVVARHFATVLAPDDILTKDNHCLVSGLYKQKIFNQTVPHITEAVRTANTAAKPNYLTALSGVLRWLPYSILEPSLASLMAPLLQCLDLTGAAAQDVKTSTLTIFESLLMHDPRLAAEHIASVVTRLLNCSSGPPINHPGVRAKALQCLALVPRQVAREKVLPYRRQVVNKLLAALDDGRRSVRVEAVKCRTAWLGLEEGGDDDE